MVGKRRISSTTTYNLVQTTDLEAGLVGCISDDHFRLDLGILAEGLHTGPQRQLNFQACKRGFLTLPVADPNFSL
jgi:hypothetical protein